MGNIKTAVSLQKSLYDEADALARELNISRSRLVTLALEDFIRNYQNGQLLDQINAAYADAPDPRERELQRRMLREQRNQLEGEW